MLRQDQLRTLRQTHQTASTVMPLVTAGLALMSALLAAQERRTAQAAPSPERQGDPLDLPRVVRVTTPRMSVPTTRPITPATPHMAETPAPARERRPSLIGSMIR